MESVMKELSRWVRTHSGIPFTILGFLVISAGVLHVWFHTGPRFVILAELVIPSISGLSLIYGGHKISSENMTLDNSFNVMSITLLLTAAALLITGFNLVIDTWANDPLPDPFYALLVSGGAGAAIGAPLGFYFISLRESHYQLDSQYQYTLTLNKRLSIVHRVLRHNLRNELTIISGVADLLGDNPTDEEIQRYVQQLDTHINELLDLTEKSKLIGRVWEPSSLEQTDVSATVERALDEIRSEYPEINFSATIPDVAPAVVHPLFFEAIEELLRNAAKHNETRELQIEVIVRTEVGQENLTQVIISDTGSGIPQIEIDALHQSEEKPLSHGSGLGLWLVYSIVTKSRGELTFVENSSSGTVIQIEIPSPKTPYPDKYATPVPSQTS